MIDVNRLVGFCLLIGREVIDAIGLLDEQFGIGWFDDDDYCLRAIAAGFRAVIAGDAFVHHYGGRTFLGAGVDTAALWARTSAGSWRSGRPTARGRAPTRPSADLSHEGRGGRQRDCVSGAGRLRLRVRGGGRTGKGADPHPAFGHPLPVPGRGLKMRGRAWGRGRLRLRLRRRAGCGCGWIWTGRNCRSA